MERVSSPLPHPGKASWPRKQTSADARLSNVTERLTIRTEKMLPAERKVGAVRVPRTRLGCCLRRCQDLKLGK